ncbi:Pentatricopeptide repeat-containing protein [Thalictrum thalictroides]|uniref:Pentatricopeptide repeat-containing protein n=1 Tax=Thalictrum thalictroides TaxID=46969 RepID=A0A7J6X821_THATH|nr:Pentatricopeptide repeat-containing protein [Thalictrum thalictroides]
MVGRSVKPDVVTYTCLIHGLCRFGRQKEAMSLFEKMLSQNIKPNVTTCSILVDFLSKQRRIKDAFQIVEMMSQTGMKPNVVTYNSLIHGLCVLGQGHASSWRKPRFIHL